MYDPESALLFWGITALAATVALTLAAATFLALHAIYKDKK